MKHSVFLVAKILSIALTLNLITVSTNLAWADTTLPPVDANLFKKLQNVPTLDLANPRLESQDYAPLGLKVITAPAEVKQAILKYVKNHSLTATPHLNNCRLQALNVETDDNPTTWEWLVTYPNPCRRLSAHKVKNFWLVQREPKGQMQVLLAERAYQVRIWQDKPSYNGRRIEVMLQDHAVSRYNDDTLPVQCHAMYHFNGQQYALAQHSLQVYREDPMTHGKNWMDVQGADPYAQVDQNFQCRED